MCSNQPLGLNLPQMGSQFSSDQNPYVTLLSYTCWLIGILLTHGLLEYLHKWGEVNFIPLYYRIHNPGRVYPVGHCSVQNQKALYKWYISGMFPANWVITYHQAHLLREPKTAIESPLPNLHLLLWYQSSPRPSQSQLS